MTVAAGAGIDFVAPAREGDVLVARAEERTRFGRSGVYDVTVLRGDDVIAEFRGRSRTVGDSRRSREDAR
jgi:acyl-CoA thioesterase